MLGAIVGDMIGSVHEGRGTKTKEFPLWVEDSKPTDDSVLTHAVAEWLLDGGDLVDHLHRWYHAYPFAGFGSAFRQWAGMRERKSYFSYGNGSAMRVSPVAWAAKDLDDCLLLAQRSAEVTHDHPQGIKGAQAVAAAIFHVRQGMEVADLQDYLEETFGYFFKPLSEIRPTYRFEVSCQASVPQAIQSYLEAESFEDAIRNAISLGGDADTQAAISGSIAEARFGVPVALASEAARRLDGRMAGVLTRFRERWPTGS